MSDLARFQAVLAQVFLQPDTRAALASAARDPQLAAELRESLAAASAEGVRMSALIVVRLRFERVLHGSEFGAAWFERDPKAFAAAFKRYHADVPPTAQTPWDEAPLFDAWAADDVDAPRS